MSAKRAILYLASLLLVAVVVYLTWPRGRQAAETELPGEAAGRRLAGTLGVGGLPRSTERKRVPVSGSVRDATTAAGIGGVTLTFRTTSGGEASVRSEASGSFKLELAAGVYQVVIVADEHVPAQPGPAVVVTEDEPVKALDFWLQRTGTVAGRVVDGRGGPVKEAVVGPHGSSASTAPPMTARSDGQGRFSLRVAPGQVVLRADTASLGAALSRPIFVQAGSQVSGVEIVLAGGGGLAGRVIGPDGAAVPGASVLVQDELGIRRMPCAADGKFAASGLAPGTKQVQASARGFSPSQVIEASVQVGPARPSLVLQLGASKSVGGRVLSPEGAPVLHAVVALFAGTPQATLVQLSKHSEVLTDESGAFQFSDVPNLPLSLSARGPGNAVTTRSGVAPGAEDVILRLQATGSIVGLVTDGQSGRPITDFTVNLTAGPHVGRGASPAGLRVASARGQFVVEDLLPGSYALVITAAGYGPVEKRDLGVTAGHAARADAALDGAGRIGGLVVDGRGVGVPGASIRVDSGWFGAAASSDSSGAFLLRDVARGRRSLSASHPEFNTRVMGGVSVFAAETATVRVELTPRRGSTAGLNLTGIGATLTSRGGRLVVMHPMAASPAEIAGLLSGDQLLAIDGHDTSRLSFPDAIESLRGIPGTPVRVRVQRGEQTFELHIIRAEVSFPGR